MAKKPSSGSAVDDELVHACRDGSVERVDKALAAGANLELDTAGGQQRPLFIAATHGHAHLFRFLLGRGADVLKATKTDVTPLLEAASHDWVGIVEMCLDAGDSVERQDRSGQTPLMRAVGDGAVRTVKLLLARGASADAMPQHGTTVAGTTALHRAGMMRPGKYLNSEATQIVQALQEAGADLMRSNSYGETLFHIASRNEPVPGAWLDWLLELGFSADQPDAWGMTPLWSAARSNQFDRVAWLLSRGANPNARTTKASAHAKAGVSVYEIALPQGDLKLLAALRNAGAVSPPPARPTTPLEQLRVGVQVVHATFGTGEIIAREGMSPHVKLTVKFADGDKVLLARFVSLPPAAE